MLLWDAKGCVYAAVHAGWRGSLGGIVGSTVARMVTLGSRAASIHAVMGPHIRSCCYPVDRTRADAFRRAFPTLTSHLTERRGIPHIDLSEVNRYQLLQAGVSDRNITSGTDWTYCHGETYFSFRRKDLVYGEMMGYITMERGA